MSGESGGSEARLIEQLRPVVRAVLAGAGDPMSTTAVTDAVNRAEGRVPSHLVYRTLVALERGGEAARAGRAGTAGRAEVLWQLAVRDADLNREFERLAAEHGSEG